jgi:hypothetical protein
MRLDHSPVDLAARRLIHAAEDLADAVPLDRPDVGASGWLTDTGLTRLEELVDAVRGEVRALGRGLQAAAHRALATDGDVAGTLRAPR